MSSLPIIPPRQTGVPSAPFTYFAYGSTLDAEALRAWCEEHGYRPLDLSKAAPAVLSGWRLVFNVRSRFWGGAVASLVPDPGSTVEGIALPLPGAGREFTRHKEGVASGLYREIEVSIRCRGEDVPAVAYVGADDRVLPGEEKPAPKFLEAMIRGAAAFGLSPAWIGALKTKAG